MAFFIVILPICWQIMWISNMFSKQIGHNFVTTTLNTYTNVLKSMRNRTVKKRLYYLVNKR